MACILTYRNISTLRFLADILCLPDAPFGPLGSHLLINYKVDNHSKHVCLTVIIYITGKITKLSILFEIRVPNLWNLAETFRNSTCNCLIYGILHSRLSQPGLYQPSWQKQVIFHGNSLPTTTHSTLSKNELSTAHSFSE